MHVDVVVRNAETIAGALPWPAVRASERAQVIR